MAIFNSYVKSPEGTVSVFPISMFATVHFLRGVLMKTNWPRDCTCTTCGATVARNTALTLVRKAASHRRYFTCFVKTLVFTSNLASPIRSNYKAFPFQNRFVSKGRLMIHVFSNVFFPRFFTMKNTSAQLPGGYPPRWHRAEMPMPLFWMMQCVLETLANMGSLISANAERLEKTGGHRPVLKRWHSHLYDKPSCMFIIIDSSVHSYLLLSICVSWFNIYHFWDLVSILSLLATLYHDVI